MPHGLEVTTLLHELHDKRKRLREALRLSIRARLRRALQAIYSPGTRVWLFGSITRVGRFDEYSDIDLAVEAGPTGRTLFWLQGELELRMGCAVDVLLIDETRLRSKIERESEMWTL
jgi:predicted nucleotidyltransferase